MGWGLRVSIYSKHLSDVSVVNEAVDHTWNSKALEYWFSNFDLHSNHQRASQVALMVKNPPANEGDLKGLGSIPGSGRSPGGGHGNLLQDSCLENPMDRGTWQATVHSQKESDMAEATQHTELPENVVKTEILPPPCKSFWFRGLE